MLDKISFEGYEVAASTFKEINVADRGFYNVSLEDNQFVSEKSDDGICRIFITFDVIIKGYPGERNEEPDDESLAFSASLQLTTEFLYDDITPLADSEIEKNMWFFDNFNYLSVKLAAESLLKNTALDFVRLPWNPN